MKWFSILLFLIVVLTGCAQTEQNSEDKDSKNRVAVLETNKGTIKFELYEQRAPITTANFIKLASSGFYDGLTFHRVVPGLYILLLM